MNNVKQESVNPVQMINDMQLSLGENLTLMRKAILDGQIKEAKELTNALMEMQIVISDQCTTFRQVIVSMISELEKLNKAGHKVTHSNGPDQLVEYTTENIGIEKLEVKNG